MRLFRFFRRDKEDDPTVLRHRPILDELVRLLPNQKAAPSSPPPPSTGVRVTEAGLTRITEAGAERVIES